MDFLKDLLAKFQALPVWAKVAIVVFLLLVFGGVAGIRLPVTEPGLN